MSKRISLADQIAQLEDAAPVDFDPEDEHVHAIASGEDDGNSDNDNGAAARAHYVAVGPSALRAANASIAHPKYDGVRTTRRQLEDVLGSGGSSDSGGEELAADQDMDDDISARQGADEDQDDEGMDEEEGPGLSPDDGDSSDVHDSEEEPRSESPPPRAPPRSPGLDAEDPSALLRKTRDEDRKKGRAVSRQLALWDSLLDARIRLQKCASAANRLPESSKLTTLASGEDARVSMTKFLSETLALSEDLFELQETLLDTNESVKPPPRKRRRTQDTQVTDVSPSDLDAGLPEATQALAALEHATHPHLVHTLQKWSSKIQAVAPTALLPAVRPAFSNKGSVALRSAVQLVDDVLADPERLLKRTRVRRGAGMEGEEEDAEVFDDTDFYQQLLRDVIDSHGERQDDWTAMQKQRKAQKKKTVDTKASKGRKLRYDVHEKLQSFMVPVPVAGSWHDSQVDELFASLLGRGFEVEAAEEEGEAARRLEEELGAALQGGFRVFG